MNLKVYLDNNFFDEYESCNSAVLKNRIKTAFKRKKLSFYPSKELLNEMIRILETKRALVLEERKKLFFELRPTRFFKYCGDIISDELHSRASSIYLTNRETETIKGKFINVKSAGEISDLSNGILEENRTHWDYYKTLQDKERSKWMKSGRRKTIPSFEEFNKIYMDTHCLPYIRRLLRNTALDSNIAGQQALKIFNNIDRYPYFECFFRLISSMLFKYLNEDRKVEKNDFYDVIQLIYMVGLDVLITNDKNLRWLCGIIFNNQKRVVSFNRIASDLISF